jgi:predicted PurR-regulated permease PerM
MDWSFLDVFWAICIFFAWVFFFYLVITVFSDLFRRHDIGGGTKTLWVLFVLFLPFLGVFVYLITQGRQMAERGQAEAQAAQADFDSYVRSAAGSGGAAAEIEKAKQLLDSGAITQAEFETMKAKALAAPAS